MSFPFSPVRSHGGRRFAIGAAALSLALTAGLVTPTASGAQVSGGDPEPVIAEDNRYAPFATATEFVEQQYVDILRRQPGADEVAYQAGLLEAGRDPVDLIVEFVESPEANSNIKAVIRLYRTYFLRNPDHLGLNHWVHRRQQGIRLGDVSNQFAASPEFALRYGTLDDAGFVDLVYHNVMRRDPDANGKAYWEERLSAGLYRGQLMTSFSDSREYTQSSWGQTTAVALYDGMYDRSIPRGLADSFGPSLQSGRKTLETLVSEFLADPRYHARF